MCHMTIEFLGAAVILPVHTGWEKISSTETDGGHSLLSSFPADTHIWHMFHMTAFSVFCYPPSVAQQTLVRSFTPKRQRLDPQLRRLKPHIASESFWIHVCTEWGLGATMEDGGAQPHMWQTQSSRYGSLHSKGCRSRNGDMAWCDVSTLF